MYLACRKRVVKLSDKELDFGCWYLHNFLCPKSYAVDQVLKEAWHRLMELYRKDYGGFKGIMIAEGIDAMLVKEAWNVVNVKIKYRFDDPVFQTPDFWLLPNETWSMGYGDCEDTSFLLASVVQRIINNPFEPKFGEEARVYAVIGFYRDFKGRYFGHGYVLFRYPRVYKGWLWLESTLEEPIAQGYWLVADFNRLIPVYFFNTRESYRIDRDYKVLGLTEDYVKTHEQYIKAMIEYVESGKWLKLKWIHKGRRTPDVKEKIITVK